MKKRSITRDWRAIQRLGTTREAAKRLGLGESKEAQSRVRNWKARGVPWEIIAKHQELFE